ncbi:MAG: APC family permease [Gammaproteobacteria bacterium]|jgi:amino acid transporter
MKQQGKIGLWGAVAIGIGGMVGGGIFAVLGLSVQLTHGGAPLAFLFAGLVALLTGYSYARLSVAIPSQGGTVEFLNQAFGSGLFSGSLNILLWLSYIIMLALYAYAFGSYGASLFGDPHSAMLKHSLITAVILALTLLNIAGSQIVSRAETGIVVVKVIILLGFVLLGLQAVQPARLTPDTWSPPLTLLAGGMLIFLAYEGFELIANTARDIRDPAHNLPRAFYIAIGFVILLYIAVAAVTVGTLSLPQIIHARDYALAEAARPFLGATGYTLIGIAALLSTASAINATLYGAARVSYILAKDGELPEQLEHRIWNQPLEGLLLTTFAALLAANLFDLSSIATIGSAGFLVIFALVNLANFKLHDRTHGKRPLAAAGVLACLAALAALLVQTWREDPQRIWVLAGLVGLSSLIEWLYRRRRNRRRQ